MIGEAKSAMNETGQFVSTFREPERRGIRLGDAHDAVADERRARMAASRASYERSFVSPAARDLASSTRIAEARDREQAARDGAERDRKAAIQLQADRMLGRRS